MAHRMFVDASAREWLVWDVIPQSADRREARASGETSDSDRDPGLTELDRRARNRVDVSRTTAHLPSALAEGWLCFESGAEKRRLAPIPPNWDRLADGQLEDLLLRAERATPRVAQLDTEKLRALSRPRN